MIIKPKISSYEVPSDPGAKYEAFSIDKTGENTYALCGRRFGKDNVSELFTIKEFDLKNNTFRYLKEGESLLSLLDSKTDGEFGPIVDGAIPFHQIQFIRDNI